METLIDHPFFHPFCPSNKGTQFCHRCQENTAESFHIKLRHLPDQRDQVDTSVAALAALASRSFSRPVRHPIVIQRICHTVGIPKDPLANTAWGCRQQLRHHPMRRVTGGVLLLHAYAAWLRMLSCEGMTFYAAQSLLNLVSFGGPSQTEGKMIGIKVLRVCPFWDS
ncbi:hypothetical protein EDB80DRAFT_268148 [Ilyonectria destructans]|nr:hypothetical protein EDB80DRAFT_268148 [Ilyonectria destructans]